MSRKIIISERDLEMKRMYVDQRMTYREIAEHYGISRQRVCQVLGKFGPEHVRDLTEEECVYPGLRKWMNDRHMSKNELCRRMNGKYSSQLVTQLSRIMRGKTTEFSKVRIDKLLKVTGLTYEEMFGDADIRYWQYRREDDAPLFMKNRYYCPYCGHYQLEGYQRYCSSCGKRVHEPTITLEDGSV